jgi:cysteine desulfuration protein SufE
MNHDFLDVFSKLKSLSSPELIYQEIINLGKSSPYKNQWDFLDSDKVLGCQSLMYVRFIPNGDKVLFEFFSDALISQGLAALLVLFYNGMTFKEFLTTPPTFLGELNMGHLLSPGRSNGINSLYRKMVEIVLLSIKTSK